LSPDVAHHRGRRGPGRGQALLRATEPTAGPRAEQLLRAYRLSDPGLAELTLEPLLAELLDRVKLILDADTVAILLLDETESELVARAARGIEEEVEQGVRIPVGGGFAGRIAAERAPIFIADVDHADVLNPILRAKGIRSLLGVPLVTEGETIGVLHVGTLVPRQFTNEDAALLQMAASRAAPAIERARLFEALEREHRSAVALQRSLLPERLPTLVGVETAARYRPARDEVGGDWYDVIELPRGLVGVAIGDVAGHGVRAASLMGQLRTALRAYALEHNQPGETLRRLDRLIQTLEGRGMATVAYAVLDPTTGVMRYASAGHPPAVILPAEGEARLLESERFPPLGTLSYANYRDSQSRLEPGETILLYTDGLIERRTESISVGLERLRAAAGPAATPEELCQQVLDRVADERGEDDVAVVALRNLPIEPVLALRLPADPDAMAPVRQTLRRWLRAHDVGAADIAAITLACGEACANAIEHAYAPGPASIELEVRAEPGTIVVTVRDAGRWRASRGTNRGRGLSIMRAAMEEVQIRSSDRGTDVVMRRRLGS
jgi:anti-sigma regulatory factor (Ser/Thr protein kinase)/putative methionine-R-sulfoxide reductase with GAF domain